MKKFLSAILIGTIFILTMSVAFAANYVGNYKVGNFSLRNLLIGKQNESVKQSGNFFA